MVTIVPKEVFDELNKKVSEAEPKKQKFDYKDFKKEVFHYSMVKDYLKDKEIKFVGQGSGRTAYMIPKGACVGHEDSAFDDSVASGVSSANDRIPRLGRSRSPNSQPSTPNS